MITMFSQIPAIIVLSMAIIAISILGFRKPWIMDTYLFSPQRILADKEYHRIISSSLFHINGPHLLFNFVSLFSFGTALEKEIGSPLFLLLFFLSVIGGNLLTLGVHRQNEYRAAGASGGICGLILAYIFILPGGSIGPVWLPVGIPDYIYAVLFFIGSIYCIQGKRDNIAHEAHLGGGATGLLLAALINPAGVADRIFLYVLLLCFIIGYLTWTIRTNGGLIPLRAYSAALFKSPFSGARSTSFMNNSKSSKMRKKMKIVKNEMEVSNEVSNEVSDEVVDEILKKISKSGVESISSSERTILCHASKQYSQKH